MRLPFHQLSMPDYGNNQLLQILHFPNLLEPDIAYTRFDPRQERNHPLLLPMHDLDRLLFFMLI
mgnify:CR=1 FL=1